MKEIKFRAWDTENHQMIEWGDLKLDKDPDDESINIYEYEGDGMWIENPIAEICEFTGLHDKNSTEIYDGDILKRTVTIVVYGSGEPPEDVVEYLKVEYREDYAGFYIGEQPLHAYVGAKFDVDTGCKCTDVEVVGNIFEDSQLLEVSE